MKLSLPIHTDAVSTMFTNITKSGVYQAWLRNSPLLRPVQQEVVNGACLSIILLNLLISCTHFWSSYRWFGIISLLTLGLLLLNKSGFFLIVRWLFLLGICSLAWLFASTDVQLWLIAAFYLTGLLLCLLLFSPKERWQSAGSVVLFIGCFTLLQLGKPTSWVPVAPTGSLFDQVFLVNIGCVVVSVLLAIGYLFFTYERSDRQLRILVNTLQVKEMEIQAQNEELRVRNHELDNYVYRVSHDLRSPLCSMLGLVNLAKHTDDIATLRSYLDLIENSVRKSDTFIQSILNHSKILNAEVQVETIDIEQIIQECREEMAYLTDEKITRFTTQVESSAVLYADKFRLTVIIQSLLSNALRFYKPDAATRNIHVMVSSSKTDVRITVSDDGVGIEPQHVPKIFDMFFRGTERSNGSGLGLYIARQAVEKMGGDITVVSQPNAGSTFEVKIRNQLPV